MNYLCKCVISAIEHRIFYTDSYDLGVIIGERVKLLADNNVEGCNTDEFLKGVQKGFQKATIKSITESSNECD